MAAPPPPPHSPSHPSTFPFPPFPIGTVNCTTGTLKNIDISVCIIYALVSVCNICDQ